MAPAPLHRPGVILVAHGSARSGASAEPVLALARALRRRGFPEVRTAFWKEEPFLHQALDTTRSGAVVVLPVFLAEGYFSRTVVPRELDLSYGANVVDGRRVHLLAPLGSSPAMAPLVAARAREAAPPGAALSSAALVVMGHGTERDPGSAAAVLDVCARLRTTGEFGRVVAAFIDQAPRVEDALAEADEPIVLLVPFLVAAGWHGGTTVPRDLGLNGNVASIEHAGTTGRTVVYTEPVGTHPALVDAVETELRSTAEPMLGSLDEAAANAPLALAEAALRARLEATGSLRILEVHVATVSDRYELRHVVDAHAPDAMLTELVDAEALERHARTTAGGRHRPLRTAAGLAPGWRLPVSGARPLVEALVALYGPAITHWHTRARGELAVYGFREIASRQSGIYAELTRAEPAAVEAGIRHTCEGLPCLRRRLWMADGETAPAEPRGEPNELVVPCPAACPVLLTTVLELLGAEEPARG